MDKVYLICFNQAYNGIEHFGSLLDDIADIVSDWRADLPNSCYVKSTEDAQTISNALKEKSPSKARFFICEITDNCDGYITEATWPFILPLPESVSR